MLATQVGVDRVRIVLEVRDRNGTEIHQTSTSTRPFMTLVACLAIGSSAGGTRTCPVLRSNSEPWQLQITAVGDSYTLPLLYYVLKLDHLLCVPAMVCLYLGLKSLLKNTAVEEEPSKLS